MNFSFHGAKTWRMTSNTTCKAYAGVSLRKALALDDQIKLLLETRDAGKRVRRALQRNVKNL